MTTNEKVSTFYVVAAIKFDPLGESCVIDSRNCNLKELRKTKRSLKTIYNQPNLYRIVTCKQKVVVYS